MTLLSEIERLATVYETHVVIGLSCSALGYIFGFIHAHSRGRKS